MTTRSLTLVLTADEAHASLRDGTLPELVGAAAAVGVDEVVVEVDTVPPGLIEACRRHAVQLLIGLTCFHEHGTVTLDAHPHLWPLGADGARRSRLEWYTGLVPTDPACTAELLERASRLAAVDGVSGLVADFIRWPLHWELECRPEVAARSSTDYSFDPATIADLNHRLRLDLPTADPTDAALWARSHQSEWEAFRCAVITDIVHALGDRLHAAGKSFAAFVVPIPSDQRRALVGQDVTAWGQAVDAVYPMTYHAILHQPLSWVGDIVADLERHTAAPVVPVLQLTSLPEFAGESDWGPPFPAKEVLAAVDKAARSGRRVALFPGSALQGPLLTGLHRDLARAGTVLS